jgi:hypothetical protein
MACPKSQKVRKITPKSAGMMRRRQKRLKIARGNGFPPGTFRLELDRLDAQAQLSTLRQNSRLCLCVYVHAHTRTTHRSVISPSVAL